ncbi:hypothetical protein B0J12DRAFT_733321 [Macrophomina phaseolina]|uniref:Transmembrane protein n=1 Tax=Macrophomina phaseolina TaxID=35725 RepID=A0ABQ8FSD2_9PEZI|nr:hypothetical protein B0J12DRAFT_733321 [Macrophomina phaseolina]
MGIATLFFGLFLGLFLPTLAKVVQQTRTVWKRTRRLSNVYLYMIWAEAVVNLIFAITTFLYLEKYIQGSFAFLFGTVTLWSIQTQLLSQIIANRVSIIMVNRRKARLLKWGLFIAIGAINIAVYAIGIPAHMLSATETQILVNNIFERIDKSFFLLLDFGLNLYFLYLVRYRLIADGLSKYWPLFKFNAAIVVIPVAMDAVLLGLLSLPNPADYVQFAPVVYIIKLYIELVMAVLISKVVRSNSPERVDISYSGGTYTTNHTHLSSRVAASAPPIPQQDDVSPGSVRMDTNISGRKSDYSIWPTYCSERDRGDGIVKTVTTVVHSKSGKGRGVTAQSVQERVEDDDDDSCTPSASTGRLVNRPSISSARDGRIV